MLTRKMICLITLPHPLSVKAEAEAGGQQGDDCVLDILSGPLLCFGEEIGELRELRTLYGGDQIGDHVARLGFAHIYVKPPS